MYVVGDAVRVPHADTFGSNEQPTRLAAVSIVLSFEVIYIHQLIRKQQQQTPTPLHIPNPGDPLYMAPDSAGRGSMEPTPASAASSSRLGTQAARSPTRSPGPLQLPGGSILNAPTWPSVKNLDMLSASERVLHNNMACLAFRLDQIQNALVHIASGRGAAGKFVLTGISHMSANTNVSQARQQLSRSTLPSWRMTRTSHFSLRVRSMWAFFVT